MIDVDALKARTNLAEVVGHYTALQKRGQEFVGRCVWHSPDNNPSMWVVPAKGLVHCFACGGSGDVIEFIQHVEGCDFKTACEKLGATDQWSPSISLPPRIPRPNRVTSKPPPSRDKPDMRLRDFGDPVGTWAYFDAVGDVIGYVARYQGPDGKEYRPWTWGAYGEERPEWGIGQWTKPRPLYGLDRLAGKPDAPVIIVEGEKAADAAAALLPAYAVVTWPGGADGWRVVDYLPLAGRTVLLWPDEDQLCFKTQAEAEKVGLNEGDLMPRPMQPGIKAINGIADLLSDPKGLACTVSVLDVEGMPDGFDAADWSEDTAALIAWAKPRKQPYGRATAPPPAAPEQPPETTASPPPPEPATVAQAQPPKRQRPALSVVGGSEALALDPEAEALPQALSDDALADYFAAQHGETLKYVPELSTRDVATWFEWAGDGWRRDVLEQYFPKAVNVTRRACFWSEAAILSPAGKRALNGKGKAVSLLEIARRDLRMATRLEIWDADQWLLGIPGGSIDLRTGAARPAAREDYITKRCAVAPVPGEHPLFDRVLARATDGDAAMLAYLWRWFGYMLTGDTREECFLFLHGKGGSGKSTLTTTLGAILGDYAVSCKMETFAETKQPKHAEELARLDGARLALTSETDEGQRWNESRIKWLTGRNKITANYMRSNSFEFTPRFKLLIEGNHRPGLKSVGEEMRRRIHLLEYAGSIPEGERDKTLKDRLVAEYPAILASMITGCLAWQREGLNPPGTITENVKSYLESEDTLGAWLEECCDVKEGLTLPASAGYKSFRDWTDRHGEFCPSQKRFSQKLEDRGFAKKRSAAGVLFHGIAVKLLDVPAYDFRD